MPNWDEIQKEWETTKITLAALAEKHDVPLGTLKSRKSRDTKNGDPWSRGAPKKDATKTKKDATIKKVATPKEVFVESDDLTDKQRLFCIYYIKSFNATMSAIKAGYSRHSAHVQGSRLLRNDNVATEIRRLKGEMRQGIFIDAMDVLNKYIQIAFADITDFVEFGSIERAERNEDGGVLLDENFKPITYKQGFVDFKESDEVDGTIITELKLGRDGVVVKLADKMKALDFLTKHFEMNPDRAFTQRIAEERLAIDKARLTNEQDGEKTQDDWKDALLEVAERRRELRKNE